jgi:hypothetical protein
MTPFILATRFSIRRHLLSRFFRQHRYHTIFTVGFQLKIPMYVSVSTVGGSSTISPLSFRCIVIRSLIAMPTPATSGHSSFNMQAGSFHIHAPYCSFRPFSASSSFFMRLP